MLQGGGDLLAVFGQLPGDLRPPLAGDDGDAPLVSFNAEDRGAHPVFAVKRTVVDGDTDPSPPVDKDGRRNPATTTDPSFPAMAYLSSDGSIRGTEYVKVFPDRARTFLSTYVQWLAAGLEDPSSVPGQELRDPLNKFTVDEAFQAWTRLQDPSVQDQVLRRLVNSLVLHELGHACGGLPDHMDDVAPSEEARQCLMFNRGKYGHRRMVVLTALGRGDSDFAYPYHDFCRNVGRAGYRCYGTLNVRDW